MKSIRDFKMATLAGAAVAALILGGTPTYAQSGTGHHNYNIPSGTLAQASRVMSAQSGFQVTIKASGTDNVAVSGLAGDFSDEEAFTRLLSGTGLTWHLDGNVVTIDGSVDANAGGQNVLSAVRIEGAGAFQPVDGFGLGAGSNGSTDALATEGTRSLSTSGSSVATKIGQTLKETPQSVSVITSDQIQRQNLTSVYSALQMTPGISVAQTGGTNSLGIYSRGYQVSTYSVDGGAPMSFISTNNGGSVGEDMSEYDRVEVLKGSAGLFGGASAPGGVVNLQRKRPLDHQQLIASAQLGEWNHKRTDVDVSSPIALQGALRARFVASYFDEEKFYAIARENALNLYGTVEADIDANTVVRIGGSYRRGNGHGENFVGLPRFSTGGDLNLPIGTNFSTSWANSQTRNNEQFATIEHRFSPNWSIEGSATRREQGFTAFAPSFLGVAINDQGDGFRYTVNTLTQRNTRQWVADAHLNGGVDALGHLQKFVLGADYQKLDADSTSLTASAGPVNLNVFNANLERFNRSPVRPTAQSALLASVLNTNTEQWGIYGTFLLEPIRGLHLTAGTRLSNYTSNESSTSSFSGFAIPPVLTNYHASNHFTFTGAATYDLTSTVSLYASYADIFNPQSTAQTADGSILPPLSGKTYEAGVKGAFYGGKLNTSLAFFMSNQSNIAIQTSVIAGNSACCYIAGGEQKTRGIELQVSGEISKGWQMNAGYTYTDVRFNQLYLDLLQGGTTSPAQVTMQPKHQIKVFTTYTPTWLDKVTVQGSFRLDSTRYTNGSVCPIQIDPALGYCEVDTVPFRFTQPTYTLFDLGVEYRATKHWSLSANLTNIGSTKYYASTFSTLGYNYYGEPRRFLFTLRGTY